MTPRSPCVPRVGAIAVVSLLTTITGCTPATLGVSPETASVIATVLANLPPGTLPTGTTTTTTSSSRTPSRSPSRTSSRARIPESPPATSAAAGVLRTAQAYLGVKYVWGGSTPRGFDCSGFARYVFAKHGVDLPRTSREQAHSGSAVPADFRYLIPGDLMFFAEPGQAISHVAIYAGNGRIIHSSTSTSGVGYTDLNSGGDWFVAYFVAARRVL